MDDAIARSRRSYKTGELTEDAVPPDPLSLFSEWIAEAFAEGIEEANGMALATVSGDGVPSCRIVLLRGASSGGFDFYTNYRSAKAGDLTDNSQAAATFWWPAMERQVRITGTVEKVDESVSDAYFASRPRGHKLSAWASPQSRPVAGRDELAALAEEAERRFQDDVPRPPHWGGYRLVPRAIEFWQGRENRLHDRLRYSRNAAGNWTITRLAP